MGKKDELADLLYALKQAGIPNALRAGTGDGVAVPSLDDARRFIGNHSDYELGGQIDGKVSGWLVKRKSSN